MCKPKVTQQKVEPVAQTPPPAQPAATVNQSAPQTPDEASPEAAALRAKRKGRSSLRIPLDAGVGGGNTGINVPQK
ncbi:hypothetical protein A6U96_23275 [Agrobacterium tumefaciens]|jgi:N-acetylmuramoyl-L-alanine amidase|nr:hypothetical protein A6U96_23275 [Agrobacterium tumefaciens]